MEDHIDIARTAIEDKAAFRRLVKQYYPLVYRLAYKQLSDAQDAEEVAQDTFVKVHRGLAEFRAEASLKTWILSIAWRLSLNKRRDRSRSSWRRLGLHRGEDKVQGSQTVQTPESLCLAGETNRVVRQLLEELPPALREAMVLNSFEELSYEEIARILRVPAGTVGSRIHNARKIMAKKLKECEIL